MLCLQVLLDAKVGAVKDAIIATSTEATQEASLEDLLAKVVAKWANIELSVIPYKDSKDVYILGSIDNIQVGALGFAHTPKPPLFAFQLLLAPVPFLCFSAVCYTHFTPLSCGRCCEGNSSKCR